VLKLVVAAHDLFPDSRYYLRNPKLKRREVKPMKVKTEVKAGPGGIKEY